ncbi:MAG: radical SAM protein [Promethearchaeota archaeon]
MVESTKKISFRGTYTLSLENPLTEGEKVSLLKEIKMGTREWANREINCIKGCSNYCLYCYAKGIAIHYKRCTENTWKDMAVNWKAVNKGYAKGRKGSAPHDIMFPTSHDIFLEEPYFSACTTVLSKLLKAGNKVLITTKPRLPVIQKLCDQFSEFKSNLSFRFTIGSSDSNLLKIIERNAPSFEERIKSLKFATQNGFSTSISIEPLLDATPERIIKSVKKYLSPLNLENDQGTIWIGLIKKRYIPKKLRTGQVKEFIDYITPKLRFEHVYSYYEQFYDHPRIKWKESIVKMMIKNNIKVKNLL